MALRKFLTTLLVGSITACSSAPKDPPKTETFKCPEERAQMCTREYRPVCATRDTGIRCVTAPCTSSEEKTYGNACSACADTKVIEYRAGACESAIKKE